jgi:pyruvate carboxylase
VLGFLAGELGDPPGGWPEPFRTRALEGRHPDLSIPDLTHDDVAGLRNDTRATLNRLLFPGPAKERDDAVRDYGDLSLLPTRAFFYGLDNEHETSVEIEEGKTLLLGLEAVSEPDARALRSVLCTINGQLRPVTVRDRSVATDVKEAEKADPAQPGHVSAPFAGVATASVSVGDEVGAGQAVAVIEAMKMEASITAPVDGTVERVVVPGPLQVEGGDLVVVLEPSG